jgi:hypothetical protein
VATAVRGGLRVCLATGRSYRETIDVWRQIPWPEACPREAMALIGGAMVAEPETGRTLYQRTIAPEAARAFGEALREAGYSALGIVDAWRWGFDYLAAPGRDYEHVQRRWFAQVPDVSVRQVEGFGDDHPPLLRLNAMVEPADAADLEAGMRDRFGEQLNIHAILAPNYGVTIVEAFSPRASKLEAVKYIAQAYRIGMGSVAAVGDDVNDLPLLSGAGLGVAMPDAPPTVRDAAGQVAERGLADFIYSLR